jgi:hypothetical protein
LTRICQVCLRTNRSAPDTAGQHKIARCQRMCWSAGDFACGEAVPPVGFEPTL